MVFDYIYFNWNFAKELIIFLCILFLLVAFGFYLFIKAINIDYERVMSFKDNIMGGIVAGIVVAILIDIKDSGGNIFGYSVGGAVMIFFIGLMSFININMFKEKINEKEKKKLTGRCKIWFNKTFSFPRIIKAFVFAVTIGLGAYFGPLFLSMPWWLALIIVMLIMIIFMGKLLDFIFTFD